MSGTDQAAGLTVGHCTLTSSFPASLSLFSLYSPSHGLTADGGAMQAHLHSGPDVIVSTV